MVHVIEILTWNAAENVSDEEMIAAVDNMVPDLKKLPGFKSQTLYKDSTGRWVDVYCWDTEEDARLSNERMRGKESLNRLMSLLVPESFTMEVMNSVQNS